MTQNICTLEQLCKTSKSTTVKKVFFVKMKNNVTTKKQLQ